METDLLPDVRKIVVLRATAIGDFIMALPALKALHETYPRAEIVYLGRQWHAGYLPGRLPGSHRVIAVPPPRGKDIGGGLVIDPGEEEAFFARMSQEGFDLAVQMHGGGTYSNPFVRRLNARVSIGSKAPGAPPLDRWIPYAYYQHEITRLLEIAALVGARPTSADLAPCLPVLESDLNEAAPALEQIGGPFAILHTGSTDPRRFWPAQKFAEVGDHLARSLGLKVVLTGTSMETEQIQSVAGCMREPCINLHGALTLGGMTGLMSQARVVVSNDTGPLHVALAAGAPVVGLFWVENVANFLPLYRRNFLPVIAWDRRCPLCGRAVSKDELDNPPEQGCSHITSFVAGIETGEVIRSVEQLLSLSPAG